MKEIARSRVPKKLRWNALRRTARRLGSRARGRVRKRTTVRERARRRVPKGVLLKLRVWLRTRIRIQLIARLQVPMEAKLRRRAPQRERRYQQRREKSPIRMAASRRVAPRQTEALLLMVRLRLTFSKLGKPGRPKQPRLTTMKWRVGTRLPRREVLPHRRRRLEPPKTLRWTLLVGRLEALNRTRTPNLLTLRGWATSPYRAMTSRSSLHQPRVLRKGHRLVGPPLAPPRNPPHPRQYPRRLLTRRRAPTARVARTRAPSASAQ